MSEKQISSRQAGPRPEAWRSQSELSWLAVTTRGWESFAASDADKRNTYRLAKELGIPTPQTWYPRDLDELEQIQTDFPLALKPAIKEHFIYATKAKGWRANNRAELRELFQRAATQVGPGEVMIQDLIH